MIWVFPIALLILFEALADIFAKEWSLHRYTWQWVVALSAYLIANTFWLFALKAGSGLARGGMIFVVACAVLALVLGMIIYKEHLTKIQIVGLIIGIVSLVLIFWKE